MNQNFISVTYPAFPSKATHYVLEKTFFFDASEDKTPPVGNNPKIDIQNYLNQDQEVILIEYGLGYKGEWSKVLINDKYIYISSRDIQIKNEIANSFKGIDKISSGPLYPSSNFIEHLPDYSSKKINWKEQTPNIVYEDKYSGKLCVHYEYSEVTEVKNDDDLKEKIRESCYAGTKMILDSKGIVVSQELVYDLVDRYYTFSRAEEYYFPIRKCSTLRVLVTLPIRFLYAVNILSADNSVVEEVVTGNKYLNPDSLANQNIISSIQNNDVVLNYNNKNELDIHFSTIASKLFSVFSLFTLPPSKRWIIKPASTPNIIPGLGAVNLLDHQQKIGNLYKDINEFIYNNLYEQSKQHEDGLENYKLVFNKKEVDKKDVNEWFSLVDAITLKKTKCADYEGKVSLVIDKVNLVLKDVRFFTKDNVEIPLNVGKDRFLNLESVKDKTSLNYICSIQPYNNLSEIFSSWNEENDTPLLKINNIDKLVNQTVNELFSVKSNFDESEITNFLINNHFPTITSVESQPLPISFSCSDVNSPFVSIEDRLQTIRIAESIQQKVSAYKQLIVDAQNAAWTGGTNFIKYIYQPQAIDNLNFKILLGLNSLSLDEEFAINQFMNAASSIDWPRFLQDSVKCAGIKFDPTTFTNILNDFERARQLIQTCNPTVSTNLLNQLADFQLPDLPDYNPNLSLIEDLKSLVLKIINEALVFSIRKLIEDALKFCIEATSQNNNRQSPIDGLMPDIEGNPIQDLNKIKNLDETNALLKDFVGTDSGFNNNDGVNNKTNNDNNAKELLKNLINDISPCLSVREMCDLLSGRTQNNDVYDFIISLINKKYNSNIGNINLSLKLNSKEQIQIFFKKMGSAFNLGFCSDLLDDLESSGKIPSNPLCDDGSRLQRQKDILEDKGLSPEQIDNLLNDLRKNDEDNLRDILEFLNSNDTPFNLNNIPTVLCKKGPNGELIPPAVSLAPPMKMFGKVLDTVFKPVYDNFDLEAQEWYKNTYSSISSGNKNNIALQDGKIVSKPSKPAEPSSDDKRKTAKEQIKLNYLFDTTYKNINFENNSYSVNINGYNEQKLDTELATELKRKDVIDDNKSLYNYLNDLFIAYEDKLDSDVSGTLKAITDKPSVQQLFSLGSTFYATNRNVISDPEKLTRLKKLFNFSDNNLSNALFAESISLPIRDSIVEVLQKPDVKQFINAINLTSSYNKKSFSSKEYQLNLSAINQYSNFNVSLDIEDKLESGSLFNIYSLNVQKNGFDYIIAKDDRELDSSLISYLQSFNAASVNTLSKQDIFDKFIQKKKIEYSGVDYLSESLKRIKEDINTGSVGSPLKNSFVSNTIGTANYSAFCDLAIKELSEDISNSPFSKIIKIPIDSDPSAGEFKDPGDAFLKPPDLSNPDERTTKTPMTQYMTLVIPQTSIQKACNVRPHYLDVDSIKQDIFKAKEESYCLEEIKNQDILKGKEVDTQDLSSSESTDTQSIMLDGGYRLTIRVYLHDLLLRAISIFGCYDPQVLRKDDIFHMFMTEMIEAEMRSRDNTVFNMMTTFFANKQTSLKQVVIEELKQYVLPKMAKRINEDTNEKLLALSPPQKISLKDVDDFYYKNSKLIKIDPTTKSVYIRVNGTKVLETTFTNKKQVITVKAFNEKELNFLNKYEELIFYQKIFSSNTKSTDEKQIIKDIVEEFKNSNEYKLLFDFLVPKKEMLTFLFITNVLCNSSNKKRVDSFAMTKSGIQHSLKFMATSGAPIKPNPNNYQDMKNADPSNMFIFYILMAAIKTPFAIVKAFTELTEPNIALSSKIYQVSKALVPETPSALIPAISLPLGIPIPPAFPLGIIPWINLPLSLFYLLGGLWLDSGNSQSEKDKKTSKDLLAKLSNGNAIDQKVDCSNVYNPDIINFKIENGEPIYDVNRVSPLFDVSSTAQQITNSDEEAIKQYQIKLLLRKSETYTDIPEISQYVVNPNTGKVDEGLLSSYKFILNSFDSYIISDVFEESDSTKQKNLLKNLILTRTQNTELKKEKQKAVENIKGLEKSGILTNVASQVIKNNIVKDSTAAANKKNLSSDKLKASSLQQKETKKEKILEKDIVSKEPTVKPKANPKPTKNNVR